MMSCDKNIHVLDTRTGNTSGSNSEAGGHALTRDPGNEQAHESKTKDAFQQATDGNDGDASAVTDSELRRRLVRKYDLRLMPACFLTFLFFFLDKSNIALARINGLEEDLGLANDQFNTALVLFFVTNILFNIPGNLALRRVGGGLWLPILIVSWGLVTTFTGFVTDFGGLCATRVFLGLTESSFLGGVLIYLGFFYTQDELVSRVGIFYSSTPLAGSIGGLLASGLGQVRVGGYNGWPWIFFVEGALTVLLGVWAYFLLPDTPEKAKSLTPEERQLGLHRMYAQDKKHYVRPSNPNAQGAEVETKEGAGTANGDVDGVVGANQEQYPRGRDRLQRNTVRRAIWNFMTIVMSIGAFFSIQAIMSYAMFLPTIFANMGYEALQASLMTVPPNIAGFVFCLAMCFWCQRSGMTAIPLNVCSSLGIVGYVLLLVGAQVGVPPTFVMADVQYAGTFFVAMSVNALPPLALTWLTVNASPHYVRAIALGFVLTIGNLAAFLASFTYIKTEAPGYIRGHSINLGCLTGLLCIGIITPFWMRSENRKRERGGRDYRLDPSRYEGVMAREQYELELGWLHPSYRYKM